MTFLKIAKNCLNTLRTPLPLAEVDFCMRLDLYLKDVELTVETSAGFPASLAGDSFLLNCHKLAAVSE